MPTPEPSSQPGVFWPGGSPPGGDGPGQASGGGAWLRGPAARWLRGPERVRLLGFAVRWLEGPQGDGMAEKLNHDVRETRDYGVPFDSLVGDDTIANATAAVDPSGDLSATSPLQFTNAPAAVFLRLSGGTAGTTYTVTITVTTDGGQVLVHDVEVTGV